MDTSNYAQYLTTDFCCYLPSYMDAQHLTWLHRIIIEYHNSRMLLVPNRLGIKTHIRWFIMYLGSPSFRFYMSQIKT